MPRLGAKVSLLRCTLLSSLLLLLVCSIHETEQNSYCQQIITERHLAELQELADTQMQHPGRVSFKFIDKMQLNDSICYVKAAFPLLGKILERTEFKENSSNARKMQTVRRMYHSIDENVDPCIREEDDEERMLSQMCFKEFTTSPYEMLVLVKDFFQDINQLLQNQETFEKDCSHVYHRACPGPRGAESPPGVGTDPDCNCLSPALPPATQPSLSAATRSGRDGTPVSSQLPPSPLRATLADLEAPSQAPSVMDGGSGTEELPGAAIGDTASVPPPGMPQIPQDPADSAEAPPDTAGMLSLAAEEDESPGDGELGQPGTVPPPEPAQPRGAPAPPDRPGGLRTTPAAQPGSPAGRARIRPAPPAEPVTQLRFSRMAPELRGGPGSGPRARGWGLGRMRGPEDGAGAGPSFDSGFVPGTEQRRKEPPGREGLQEPLVFVVVPGVVAVLLAVGGLLFYKYKCRVLEQPLEDGDCDPEEPERRALQGVRECPELETQDL
ncbi:macrophage colony-stimulating factor 1 isoform X1 [Pipra filicauda]|uniref:Macrophage colony-stimulating factor 1 isoform X1 n=1 Tax=Pipra filicauda TaxID=649802 RepID=A0A6J2J2E3_9PASS|nr:macrophage colony-stimulating factor 1 isoform X1 [Pipra filicauda]